MTSDWHTRPLAEVVRSRQGNNKLIKGRHSDSPAEGLVQGFSASGPDVWVPIADYKEAGIVISAVGARCGKTFIADGEWTAIANTHVLLPSEDMNARWLWYLTNDESFWIKGGAAQPFVKVKDTLQKPCLIPPLAEQQRIVGLLDEAFAGIATADTNAKKNLQNARALFDSHLQSVFTQRHNGWIEKRLEEVCVIGDGNHSSNYPKREELVADGVPFIRATNLVAGRISDDDMRFLSPEKHAQLKKGHLKAGDVLFTNRGEIGKTAMVDAAHDGSNLNSQIAWLRCNETLNNRFLFHVLNSQSMKAHLDLSKNGAALQQFTIRQIKALQVPIPSMHEQTTLVAAIDHLGEETQRLAHLYERKLAALEALKKSLLHQAFTGEL